MVGRSKAYKFKVVQEYEVYIYYEDGVIAASIDEHDEQIVTDVLETVYSNEELVVSTEDDNEGVNGYIGLVTAFEPTVKEVYSIEEMPTQMRLALIERGLIND